MPSPRPSRPDVDAVTWQSVSRRALVREAEDVVLPTVVPKDLADVTFEVALERRDRYRVGYAGQSHRAVRLEVSTASEGPSVPGDVTWQRVVGTRYPTRVRADGRRRLAEVDLDGTRVLRVESIGLGSIEISGLLRSLVPAGR